MQAEDLIRLIKDLGYDARLAADAADADRERRQKEMRKQIALLIFSAVLTLPLFIANMILMPLRIDHPILMNKWFQFVLATIIQVVVGWRFYRGAWLNLRHGSANMDVLVALGTTAAYVYSVALSFFLGGENYYESSATILTLILLGKTSRPSPRAGRPRRSASSSALQARTARVVRDGVERDVPVEDVVRGRHAHRAAGREDPGGRGGPRGDVRRGRVDADRRADAGGQGAGRHRHRRHHQQARAPSRCGRPGWARTPCWRRSCGWWRRPRAPRRRSSGWPTDLGRLRAGGDRHRRCSPSRLAGWPAGD